MNIRNLIFVPLAMAAVVAVAGFRYGGAEIGATAPSFTLPSSNGKQVSLDQYRGKYVVLEWTNQSCPYVQKHYNSGNMQATQKWAKDHGAIWLTIDSAGPGNIGYMTSKEAAGILKSRHMYSDAILLDSEGTVGHAYGAKATPDMFVIDPKGTLIYSGGIDNKPTTDVDDIKTATNYVKAALSESMAGKSITTASSRPYGCGIKYKG